VVRHEAGVMIMRGMRWSGGGCSAALSLRHFAHFHGEAVSVPLGDLQTSRQSVAADPQGQGESEQGEDEALHGLGRLVDVFSIEAGEGVETPPVDGSEIDHEGVHLHVADLVVIPCHTVGGLPDVAPDVPMRHAAHELLPRGLVVTAEGHARLSGIVEELVVLNPEGSVPGFVVCPTVVGRHGLSRLVDVVSLQGHGLVALQECAVHPLSHATLAVHQQAHHIAAAAMVGADAARVPLHDGGRCQWRQDDTLTGRAGALHVDEDGQVVKSEVQHGSVWLVDVVSLDPLPLSGGR